MSNTALKTRTLTKVDRCDRCTAQALVMVVIPVAGSDDLDLVFCGHHFTQHEPKLDEAGGSVVVDIRPQLVQAVKAAHSDA